MTDQDSTKAAWNKSLGSSGSMACMSDVPLQSESFLRGAFPLWKNTISLGFLNPVAFAGLLSSNDAFARPQCPLRRACRKFIKNLPLAKGKCSSLGQVPGGALCLLLKSMVLFPLRFCRSSPHPVKCFH